MFYCFIPLQLSEICHKTRGAADRRLVLPGIQAPSAVEKAMQQSIWPQLSMPKDNLSISHASVIVVADYKCWGPKLRLI